ncbi:MAG: hypothetical protein MRY81_09340 [Donghicola eburneus]|nr:hypothetical protein [Donghicola eburneus]MCI5039874.1 hypothetical protein [Donghicola eburneus]
MQNFLILLTTVATAAVLMHPRVANAPLWRATITPLASIIGSGFLVLGPILKENYGAYAPLIMLGLCAAAYLFGGAIQYNMASLAARTRGGTERRLETLASWMLAFAYVISVAYYINLFGSFGVSLTTVDDAYHARLLASALFVLILLVGWTRGFAAMERLEQISVGIKLAIIMGLLCGLALYFGEQAKAGALSAPPPTLGLWGAITLGFGLIVTVQGFETSRYLTHVYDWRVCTRSMKAAQASSTVIYMVYIALLTYALPAMAVSTNETAIIDAMEIVAPILPLLLVAAALSAQLSAAVADTSGSGGLVEELTDGRISPRQGYAVLVGIGLVLTWTTNVFQIISYASRAFAAYYALQSAIATVHSIRQQNTVRTGMYGAATVLAGLIVLFGRPVESDAP